MQGKLRNRSWFTGTFLKSLEERMNNPKYPNSCILTKAQASVCHTYMDSDSHQGDYGWFTNYHIEHLGKKYVLTERGKYIFLTRYEIKN